MTPVVQGLTLGSSWKPCGGLREPVDLGATFRWNSVAGKSIQTLAQMGKSERVLPYVQAQNLAAAIAVDTYGDDRGDRYDPVVLAHFQIAA
jgi:hypothetical protein